MTRVSMTRFILTSTAPVILGAWLGLGLVERGVIGPAPAEGAQGCGPGFHRNGYGVCRPHYGRYYAAPVYRPYGYRGVYGRRVYGGRVYAGRGRVGVAHYGGRRFAGGRRGWR